MLNVREFQGTVMLKHWFKDPITGRTANGVMGLVSIISAKEATGMDLTNQESNWIARIEGEKSSYNFPGCQVNAVLDHPEVFQPAPLVAGDILVAT